MTDVEISGYCWNCGHEMIHSRVAVSFFPRIVEAFSKKPDGKVDHRVWMVMYDSYQFCRCRKCDAPSMFVDSHWTKTADPGEAGVIQKAIRTSGICLDYSAKRSNFPAFDKAAFPAWTQDLEEADMKLFWEVYTAMTQGLCTIAMMGVRAIVDRYANKIIGDIGGFEKKLNKLQQNGHINSAQFEQLRIVVDAGNAASHRGISYTREHVRASLDVVESLLVRERFGDAVEKLRNATPPRQGANNSFKPTPRGGAA